MRTHSFPGGNDLITGDNIGGPEPKWPTACSVRAPLAVVPPALRPLDRTLRGTVTDRWLRAQRSRISRPGSHHSTCHLLDASAPMELHGLGQDASQGGVQRGLHNMDIKAEFGSGSPRRPSPPSSAHTLLLSLSS